MLLSLCVKRSGANMARDCTESVETRTESVWVEMQLNEQEGTAETHC